jgi:hypothetical protein
MTKLGLAAVAARYSTRGKPMVFGFSGQVLFDEFAGGHTIPDSVGADVEERILRLSSR